MRLKYQNNQFRPGAVGGRGQWIFLGIALGITAALAFNADSGWIARKELTTGLPIARSFDNPVQLAGFQRWGTANSDVIEAVEKFTSKAKADVSVQIAGNMFTDLARASRAKGYTQSDSNTTTGLHSNIDTDMQPVRERTLRNVEHAYPNSPTAIAAYIREVVSSGDDE